MLKDVEKKLNKKNSLCEKTLKRDVKSIVLLKSLNNWIVSVKKKKKKK